MKSLEGLKAFYFRKVGKRPEMTLVWETDDPKKDSIQQVPFSCGYMKLKYDLYTWQKESEFLGPELWWNLANTSTTVRHAYVLSGCVCLYSVGDLHLHPSECSAEGRWSSYEIPRCADETLRQHWFINTRSYEFA